MAMEYQGNGLIGRPKGGRYGSSFQIGRLCDEVAVGD